MKEGYQGRVTVMVGGEEGGADMVAAAAVVPWKTEGMKGGTKGIKKERTERR